MSIPLTIRREQLIRKLCDAINGSGLPAFIVVDILDRITAEERKISDAEYQRDLTAYKREGGTNLGKEADT